MVNVKVKIYVIVLIKNDFMKKITRANFEGLRQRYPVLNKEEMRRYVGGNSTTLYDESDLALLNPYTLDLDIMIVRL